MSVPFLLLGVLSLQVHGSSHITPARCRVAALLRSRILHVIEVLPDDGILQESRDVAYQVAKSLDVNSLCKDSSAATGAMKLLSELLWDASGGHSNGKSVTSITLPQRFVLTLVEHLATFTLHVGGLQDGTLRRLRQAAYMLRCMPPDAQGASEEWLTCYGPEPWKPAKNGILSDRVSDMADPEVEAATNAVDSFYRDQGFVVYFPPSLVPSMRQLAIPQDDKDACSATSENEYEFGAGLADADVELFIRLQRLQDVFPIRRIFEIGNAFGYSTLLLAHLFDAQVDAIDAEVDGRCAAMGTRITRKIVKEHGLPVHISVGFSPQDVPRAARRSQYDLAFIDGKHTSPQLALDVQAVAPRLANRSIIVLHDLDAFELRGVARAVTLMLRSRGGFRLLSYEGQSYHNLLGTSILVRGVPMERLVALGFRDS